MCVGSWQTFPFDIQGPNLARCAPLGLVVDPKDILCLRHVRVSRHQHSPSRQASWLERPSLAHASKPTIPATPIPSPIWISGSIFLVMRSDSVDGLIQVKARRVGWVPRDSSVAGRGTSSADALTRRAKSGNP